ncbi:MAG: hypothetical protein KF795_17480 [Labilithrix sp.]|nr:hypothetical protein [Labilithrix sp.]
MAPPTRSIGRSTLWLALSACTGSPEGAAPPETGEPDGGAAACVEASYPAGPYGVSKGDVLEGRTLEGVRGDGARGAVRLSDSFASCGESRVLVVRVNAAFCGTCRASAERTASWLSPAMRERVHVVDVVVRDEENAPPDVEGAVRWQARQDVRTDVVVDPSMALVTTDAILPRVLVVDPRTMRIREAMADPAPEEIADAALSVAAELRGEAALARRAVTRVDGRFTTVQWAMIQEMVLSGPPPKDPTNVHGDRPGAARFGRTLFDDKLLSPSGEVSCERCHEKHRSFTDGAETATGGVGGGTRNTPSVVLSAWSRWQLWDGRADTLWMQALLPFEDPKEFGSSRLFVAHRIYDEYRDEYEALFGPLPALDDAGRFPPNGKPGDPAWNAMAPGDRDAVTRVFVDVGKAIAAFERSFRVSPNALDRYALGARDALTVEQKDGLAAFFATGCAQCHWGPRLTDDAFHAMRFPSGHEDFTPDNGRIEAAAKYDASEFRADGKWSDAKLPRRPLTAAPRLLGSFKTPPLRGVAVTPPYGHGGSVPFLSMAIELHRTRGRPEGDRFTIGAVDPWVVPFDAERTASLLAFVQTLGFSR